MTTRIEVKATLEIGGERRYVGFDKPSGYRPTRGDVLSAVEDGARWRVVGIGQLNLRDPIDYDEVGAVTLEPLGERPLPDEGERLEVERREP
jgi:hypothetical protein